MPLLTPECCWCRKKWVVFHATRANGNTTSYRQPATSTLWPSIHLHFECAAEFMSALCEETQVNCHDTIIGREFSNTPGRDTNFPLSSQYYEPEFWRSINKEPDNEPVES